MIGGAHMRKDMVSQTMIEVIQRLYGSFRSERAGDRPSAICMNPDDWVRLCDDVGALHLHGAQADAKKVRIMGMVVLLQPKWPIGFPACMDTRAAADAIEAGAFAA